MLKMHRCTELLSVLGKRFFLLLLIAMDCIAVIQGKSLLDDNVDAPSIITRSEWGAKRPKNAVSSLTINPPPYVLIHHAASDTCTTRAICQARVRSFQDYHTNTKNWSDIGYNFLVGEDGNIYEGRGWGKAGAHAKTYNAKSIGICVIGNYESRIPNKAATDAIKGLIAYGVSLGKIDKKYSLIGHRQAWETTCPGQKLYEIIKSWPHWVTNP